MTYQGMLVQIPRLNTRERLLDIIGNKDPASGFAGLGRSKPLALLKYTDLCVPMR